ncbi:MAG TPA: lysophospholipid acyltransferase family protein [Tepidisphaeraceae bacterium]|jgi:1-acyl-sn-glycerol-3-phosphate acyltransferase
MYRIGRVLGRFVFAVAFRVNVLHEERLRRAEREGAFILAMTHLSHFEPFCSGVLLSRPIDWMTRKEFYKYRLGAWVLESVNCFKVNRQGIPVSAVREAIRRLEMGRVIGICPEGGVVRGAEAAIRGGPIKRGVCSAAIRSRAPIVPCVMLGTHVLTRVKPWLPTKSAHLYVAYGEPIVPPPAPGKSTRATRLALAEQLRAAYQSLYRELLEHYKLGDADIP